MTLYLHGVGHYHPEVEISNAFLESLDIGTTDDWITDRVGIRTRRTTLPLDYIRETRNTDIRAVHEAASITTGGMGAEAARMAIERAGISPEQVGVVVSGSSSPSFATPADASWVAKTLDIEVPAVDLNSACSSFVTQLSALSWIDPKRLPDYALIVATDAMTTTIDYNDRGTCVLFGDGSAAAVVSTRIPGPAHILHTHMASDPTAAEKVQIPRAGHFVQDGRAVQMFAIRKTRGGFERLRDRVENEGVTRDLHFIGHQANMRVLEQVCKRCNIPPELHHSNVETRGNTGCASAPSVLSAQWEKFTPRDDVALVVVGGGLTWSQALIRFGAEEETIS